MTETNETKRSIFVSFSTYPSIGLAILATLPFFPAMHPTLAIDAPLGSLLYKIALAVLAIGVFAAAQMDGKAATKQHEELVRNSNKVIEELRELRTQLAPKLAPDSDEIRLIDQAITDLKTANRKTFRGVIHTQGRPAVVVIDEE